MPPPSESTSSGGHLASRDEPRSPSPSPLPLSLKLGVPQGCPMVALAVLPQRDSTFVSCFQSVMCLDLPAPLPSYKRGQVADAVASPPLPSAFGAAILQPANLQQPGKVGPGLQTQIRRPGLRCGDLARALDSSSAHARSLGLLGGPPRESRGKDSGREERQVLGLQAGPVLKELLRLGVSTCS